MSWLFQSLRVLILGRLWITIVVICINERKEGEVDQRIRVRVSMLCDRETDGSSQLFPFTLTMLIIRSLSECHQPASASAADWFNKGHALY